VSKREISARIGAGHAGLILIAFIISAQYIDRPAEFKLGGFQPPSIGLGDTTCQTQ